MVVSAAVATAEVVAALLPPKLHRTMIMIDRLASRIPTSDSGRSAKTFD